MGEGLKRAVAAAKATRVKQTVKLSNPAHCETCGACFGCKQKGFKDDGAGLTVDHKCPHGRRCADDGSDDGSGELLCAICEGLQDDDACECESSSP